MRFFGYTALLILSIFVCQAQASLVGDGVEPIKKCRLSDDHAELFEAIFVAKEPQEILLNKWNVNTVFEFKRDIMVGFMRVFAPEIKGVATNFNETKVAEILKKYLVNDRRGLIQEAMRQMSEAECDRKAIALPRDFAESVARIVKATTLSTVFTAKGGLSLGTEGYGGRIGTAVFDTSLVLIRKTKV